MLDRRDTLIRTGKSWDEIESLHCSVYYFIIFSELLIAFSFQHTSASLNFLWYPYNKH